MTLSWFDLRFKVPGNGLKPVVFSILFWYSFIFRYSFAIPIPEKTFPSNSTFVSECRYSKMYVAILVFMVEFETVEKERRDYGNYPGEKFIEVSRNKAIQDDGSENSFLQISTGYYSDEEPQYNNRFTVPTDQKAVEHVVENLPEMFEKEKEDGE